MIPTKPTAPPQQFPLPRAGERDPYFSRTRTWWYENAVPCQANHFRPPIRSVSEVKPGNVRGRRFVVYHSALQFFERMEAEQETAPTH